MNNYEIMEKSIMKNLQELSEFVVDEFGISNYYDLVDLLVDLYNFKVLVYKRNKELAKKLKMIYKE